MWEKGKLDGNYCDEERLVVLEATVFGMEIVSGGGV